MQDLQAKREKFLTDATDCDLIATLATDPAKRETFRRLAERLRKMVQDMDEVIAATDSKHAA
jgi:CHASE3 domain sensor protein